MMSRFDGLFALMCKNYFMLTSDLARINYTGYIIFFYKELGTLLETMFGYPYCEIYTIVLFCVKSRF